MSAVLAHVLPLAHGGESHWYDTVLFVTPMFVIVAVLWWTGRRERKANARAQVLERDAAEPVHVQDGDKRSNRTGQSAD